MNLSVNANVLELHAVLADCPGRNGSEPVLRGVELSQTPREMCRV